MALLAKHRAPFPGEARENRWPHAAAHYASLPYVGSDIIDEFIMLAKDLIKSSDTGDTAKAKTLLNEALRLLEKGERSEAARLAVGSYHTLYH